MARTETRAPDQGTDAALPVKRAGVVDRVDRFLRRPDVRTPLAVFVLSRVLFLLLTYFGVVLFNSVLHGPHPSFVHSLLPAWNRWDTVWYTDIAQRGYGWKKAVGTGPAAFFPLFPLLIHLGTSITHRSALTVAMLVSNICFLGALVYLYRLATWETNCEVAARTILYIAIFPTALFFFAGYTESLFLLLTVASFYHLRRRDWLLAGMFGALASATRVTGVLLVLPFLYQYARSKNFSPRAMLVPGLAGILLVPCGLLAFMAYLQVTLGDPLAFDHYQAAWQKVFTFRLWSGFVESFREILIIQPQASFFQAHNIINVTLGALFLIWTALASRRLPAAYTIYLIAFWLVTLTSPALAGGYPVPLISLSRYVLTLFPIFLYLGILGRDRSFHDGYLVLATGMLALLTVQFVNGGWVI